MVNPDDVHVDTGRTYTEKTRSVLYPFIYLIIYSSVNMCNAEARKLHV